MEKPRKQSSFSFVKRYGALLSSLFVLTMFVACGVGGESPYVRSFRFSGQDAQNPQTFYFDIEWTDNQGDLILWPEGGTPVNGALLFTVQDLDKQDIPKEVKIPITPVMSPLGKLEGSMNRIGLTLTSDVWPARIKFTLVMTDAKGNRSNNPWVVVQSNN
ncbi:MAG: hypothetical protein H6727_08860 [Myxococcales bacterium]|nr:hypothetical protein [Myxococcales bacterium]